MQMSRRFLSATLLVAVNLIVFVLWGESYPAVFQFREIAVEIGYGTGIENTKLLRLDSQWRFRPQMYKGNRIEIIGIGQLSAGIWKGDRDIFNLSATPILRLQSSARSRIFAPYIEAGIGLHYISEIQMRRRVLSTNFQFGDHAGIGFVIGRSRAVDICYLFQHHSNASIKRPNSGINFHIIRIGYSF